MVPLPASLPLGITNTPKASATRHGVALGDAVVSHVGATSGLQRLCSANGWTRFWGGASVTQRMPMLDIRRATEDGAECVALGLIGHHCRSWRLVRRLQSCFGEGADWLFEDIESGAKLVLEISGTDDGPFEHRLGAKMGQASSEGIICVAR